jgi:hypothetical protein
VIKIGFPITKIAQIFFGDSWVLWATFYFLLMATGCLKIQKKIVEISSFDPRNGF